MKTAVTLCLALFAAATAGADDKPAPLDPAKLVGSWTYVAGTRAGEKVDKDRLVGPVVITKETFTLPGSEPKLVIGYTVNAKASPATIDMSIKDGPVKEGKAVGLVAVNGDELTICYDPTGQKRPAKFESTKDNGAFLFVLKRGK
jgi:uncharacterized protein (TIGR03067 family)